MLDGRFYIVGGYFRRDSSADVTVYDPAADAWTQAAPLPEPRNHLGVAALGGFLYAAGGGEGAGVFADAWRFDPKADAWTAIAPMPARREAFGLVSLAGKLYAVGGVVQGTTNRQLVTAYDPATDRWTIDLAPLPTLREHVTAVAFEDRVWVIGGRWASNLGTVEAYDPTTDSWQSMPDLPTPRGGLTAAVLDGKIHVTGGEQERGVFHQHEVWDPASGSWLRYPDLPTGRHGLASGVLGNEWIVAGGGPNPDLSSTDVVEAWSP